MMETLFSKRIEGQWIHGVVHRPVKLPPGGREHAVVFLHGAGGYRTGPHDLFVKLARELTACGYCCIRFDFRGWGYSGRGTSAPTGSMLEDIAAVLAYVRTELGIGRVTLAGICYGAKLALYYAKAYTDPLESLILLSCESLRSEIKSTVALNQAGRHSRMYLVKLFRKETWNKIVAGEIHYKKIVSIIVAPFRRVRKRKPSHPDKPFSPVRPFCGLQGGVLLIYGGKDPETALALPQIRHLLTSHSIPFDVHLVAGANHSFYSIGWSEEICDKMKAWLIALPPSYKTSNQGSKSDF